LVKIIFYKCKSLLLAFSKIFQLIKHVHMQMEESTIDNGI